MKSLVQAWLSSLQKEDTGKEHYTMVLPITEPHWPTPWGTGLRLDPHVSPIEQWIPKQSYTAVPEWKQINEGGSAFIPVVTEQMNFDINLRLPQICTRCELRHHHRILEEYKTYCICILKNTKLTLKKFLFSKIKHVTQSRGNTHGQNGSLWPHQKHL